MARTVRQRAREELTREILAAARRQLATDGAAALSLRAVARELGMVSSAVYRYVPSRDELLTLLIVQAYDALGSAAEQAEAAVDRADLLGRWRALSGAVRDWALANPHEYALIYGSPVPGYAAPQDTVVPAARVAVLLINVLSDALAADRYRPVPPAPALDPVLRRAIAPTRAVLPEQVPDELVVRAVMAWTHLFGAVSFEMFGHRHNVVSSPMPERAAFFRAETSQVAALLLGLPETP